MRLIDADELKTLYDDAEFADEKWRVPIRVILANIDDMPTIDPVKRGRWRPHFTEPYENEGEVYWGVCSECEEVENRKSDYCPNCGARMDGDENG